MTSTNEYVDEAISYASDVVLGDIPAARPLRLAAQRFLGDLKRADKEQWSYELDRRRAARVCRFVEKFPNVKGHQGRIRLLAWQTFVLVNLFGWIDELGARRFKTGYIEVPKKQGKSTLMAPVCLYGLGADNEDGAEVYTAAVGRHQARIVWGMAKQMALRTPAYRERYGVQCGAQALAQPDTASTFQALSREGKSLEGVNPSLAIVDELHRHQTREVWDILDESRGARMQSLLLAITNSGHDKSSICYEQRAYLLKVLEGYDDPTFFGVIYTIDEGDLERWDDPKVWAKAQPSLGHTVSVANVERLAAKARAMPSAKPSFLRYQLGVWADGEASWIHVERWDACARPGLIPADLVGKPCFIALDLASKKDVAAMVAVFRVGGAYYVLPRFYLPRARVRDNDQYWGWAEQGWLQTTPGETIHYAAIEEDLIEWCTMFDVQGAPYDRFQATQFATRMTDEGVPMVEFAQTVGKMSEPMKETERLVLKSELIHDGNPMMSWMIGNVYVLPDRKDNVYPRKEREENKIDGPVAMIMGVAMWVGEQPVKRSRYASGDGQLVEI